MQDAVIVQGAAKRLWSISSADGERMQSCARARRGGGGGGCVFHRVQQCCTKESLFSSQAGHVAGDRIALEDATVRRLQRRHL